MYFWENNPERAREYAAERIKRHRSKAKPAVVGAILHLGHCFNLLEKYHIDNLTAAYYMLRETFELSGRQIPENKLGNDKLLRHLDCAVIELHHYWNEKQLELPPYDSVRGVFQEGGEAYPGSGFMKKSHIQLSIRNPNCIKGFFWPRSLDTSFTRP